MHDDCLLHDVLTRVYNRLGTDIPHESEKLDIRGGAEGGTQDARKEGTGVNLCHGLPSPFEEDDRNSPMVANRGIMDQVLVERRDVSSLNAEILAPALPAPSDKSSKSTLNEQGRSRESPKRTWEGLFEATLEVDRGSVFSRVTDLREGVLGGEKEWTELLYCLTCNILIE